MDETEDAFRLDKTKKKQFLSTTTLEGFRVTIASVFDLTDHLLKVQNYKFVLTGKMNQDAIEVCAFSNRLLCSLNWFLILFQQRFFGIIRKAGGNQEQPTVKTFLHFFRVLSVYYPVKETRKGSNVDNEEQAHVLASYKDCMINRTKTIAKEMTELRSKMKNKLIDGLSYVFNSETQLQKEKTKTVSDNVLYHLCGYTY